MSDGLLLSEYYLRKLDPEQDMDLMVKGDEEDLVEYFRLSGKLVEDVTYTDSRVLPLNSQRVSGSSRTTLFDATMRLDDHRFEMQVKDPFSFGNIWASNTEECALVDIDYSQLPSFGITESKLINYMDVIKSTKTNMYDNEMVLVNNRRSAL